MSDQIVLAVEKRDGSGKGPAHRLRLTGKVPAVLYGHGSDAVMLSIAMDELRPVRHHAGLLGLKLDGSKKEISAVIKDLQYDVVRGTILHADFQEVRADEVITAMVQIEAHGTPVGESRGGVLDQVMHELEIRCAANSLPDSIMVEVGKLDIDQAIHIADLVLPEGAVAAAAADQVVFMLAMPRSEEVAAGGAAAVASEEEGAEGEPEVITKGKKEEGEAGE